MTQEDYAALARWQSSNDGNAAAAIYAMSTALGDLEDIARTRDGAALIRDEYQKDIHGLAVRLNILMVLLTPQKHLQAAE
jgi:hypothetical protein